MPFHDSAAFNAALELSDTIRSTLTNFGANLRQSGLAKVFEDIPQFVVVGAQSSGKSSTLSRVSGIEFPTDSGRCTRIATLLKLRRAGDDDDDDAPPRVRLRGKKSGETIDEEFNTDGASVTDLIHRAQNRALELFPDENFVESLEIEVAKTGPKLPNVTLVDLPGLIAPRPNDPTPETVERIVKRYANMPGSLILNVVPAEQDYDTGLGKGIVDPLRTKTIFVITKFDLLHTQGPKNTQQRMSQIMRETDGAAARVVALGCVGEGTTEAAELAKFDDGVLGDFDPQDLLRGKDMLAAAIEDCMSEHLRRQMPKLEAAVEHEIEKRERRVAQIEPREPVELMAEAAHQIRTSLNARSKLRQDLFRDLRDNMMDTLKKAGGVRSCRACVRACVCRCVTLAADYNTCT